jgi:hypothetical protein
VTLAVIGTGNHCVFDVAAGLLVNRGRIRGRPVGPARRRSLADRPRCHATSAELIVLPATDSERLQPADLDHAGRLIGAALAAARTALAATPVAA